MSILSSEKSGGEKKCNLWERLIETIMPWIPVILLGIVLILYILSYIFPCRNCIIIIIDFLKEKVFNESRITSLINVSVVLIGFYVTIMSIFGSNSSIAIVEISKENLANKFTSYIRTALISTFIYLVFTVFYGVIKADIIILLYAINFLWVIVNLIRIAYLSIKLYDYNIKESANIKKSEEENNQEFLNLLREIKHLEQISNKEYYKDIKNKVEDEKNRSDKELPYDEHI